MAEGFDLEALVNVEQTFYDTGYQDGLEHGRIHGLIEGKALGREKGFEMWEEIGFYEGFALTWKTIHASQSQDDSRATRHIKHLLDLISQFPQVNVSPSDTSQLELDIPKLLRQIRSRYKALCATLGVRPSIRVVSAATHDQAGSDNEEDGHKRNTIWKLDNAHMQQNDLAF